MSYEKIRERYIKNYITDIQLVRFKNLGVITDEQYYTLYNEKYARETESVSTQQ